MSETPHPSDDGEDRSETDASERADATAEGITRGSTSRRGVIAALGGLGVLGGLATVTGTGGAVRPDVARSTDAWRVEVDGETGLRLDPPRRVTLDDEDVTGSGNHVVGHLNTIADDVAGATISGGGTYEHVDDETKGNVVHSHFGAIGGGISNAVGVEGKPAAGTAASVGGGVDNLASGTASTIAGGARNEATGFRSTVGGGINNESHGTSTTVGGGIGNHAEGDFATVGGGGGNSATATYAGTAAGRGNHATAEAATIAGGHKNSARDRWATVGGGYYNKAHGYGSTIPGGAGNVADGKYAFAAGYCADTAGHDGAYVFADSSDEPLEATADDTVFFQMPVHARAFNTTSTRTAKADFEPVDPQSVLAGVADLDVSTWTFADGDDARHMGPAAEDFHETFGIGEDAESVATVDADGVALAAIQGLLGMLERTTDRIEDLEEELDTREDRVDDLEDDVDDLEDDIVDLEDDLHARGDRIDELERRLSTLETAVGDELSGDIATDGASQASP